MSQFVLRTTTAALCCACGLLTVIGAEPSAVAARYGQLPSGQEARQFTLRNRHGMLATVIEYGATLTDLRVPDRHGQFASVVLGADSLEAYTNGFPAASIIGRYANRIRSAKFTLDDKMYNVTKNSGDNHIHGGRNNFAKVRWTGVAEVKADEAVVTLRYSSADGEEGFPGDLNVSVAYALSDRNELSIRYRAETDKPM